jgi:glutaconate CoA-transferase, subunit A
MAMVFEIIKARINNLHIVNNPGGPDTDLLIGAGCVAKSETSYIGHEVFGHPYNFKRQYDKKTAAYDYLHDDWTVGSGSMRILAGAMGIPFIPTKFLRGSDLLNPDNDNFKEIRGKDPKVPKKKFVIMKDPFWEGEEVVLVPAIHPDVCILHAQEVAEDGTARISGGTFLDYYAAVASKVTIISAEKIVPIEKLLANREANMIPGELVDAIVEVPFGAHPTAVHGCYDNDPWWFQEYINASKKPTSMAAWLDSWVYGVKTFADYLAKVGPQRLEKLTADPVIGYAPDILRRLDKIGEVA